MSLNCIIILHRRHRHRLCDIAYVTSFLTSSRRSCWSISSVTDVADGSPAVTYSTSVVVAAVNVSDEARSAYRFRSRQLMMVTSLLIAILFISPRTWSLRRESRRGRRHPGHRIRRVRCVIHGNFPDLVVQSFPVPETSRHFQTIINAFINSITQLLMRSSSTVNKRCRCVNAVYLCHVI